MGGGPWVMRKGRLVSKSRAGPPPQAGRRLGVASYIISDTMDPLKHMGTGRMLDSKSEFRKDTRASGCIEVGTDPAIFKEKPRPEPQGVEMDVKRALEELRSR